MTEPIEPTEAPATEAPATQPPEPDDDIEVPKTVEQARKLRQEHRSLRARLRATETERDELRETTEALITQRDARDRTDAERMAGELLLDPSDLWRVQPSASAFRDEFGEVVADRVIDTARALIADKPHLARPQNAPPPSDRPLEGLRSGAAPDVKPVEPTWSSAIRGTGVV